jgi:hypothetical protein
MPKISGSRLLLHAVLIVVAGLLAFLSVAQALLQWKLKTPFPYWDMVSIVSFLDDNPSRSIVDLYRSVRDNEHRPIASFAFFLMDRNVYGDSGYFLYRSIFAAETITVLCFLLVLLRLRRQIIWSSRLTAAALLIYLFFSVMHFENLTWQKQIHEVSCITLLSLGVLAAAAVSTCADICRSERFDVAAAAASGALCLLASYSFAFGLVAWPVVGAHAALTRWRCAPLIVYATFAVFTIVTYALTYTILPHHTDPTSAILKPLRIADYSLTLIGMMSFNLLKDMNLDMLARPAAHAISVIAIGVAFYQMRNLYLLPTCVTLERGRPVVGFYSAMVVVIALGMTVMIALGRITINGGGDSRYAIVGAMFWSGLLVLIMSTAPPKVVSACILVFGVAAASAGVLMASRYEHLLRTRHQEMFQAATLATLGQHLWPQAPALYPEPGPLNRVWTRPRWPFRSFAERAPFGWIGVSMRQIPPAPASSRCLGHIDAVSPVGGQGHMVKLSGWGFIAADDTGLEWVLATNTEEVAIGAGVAGLSRPDVRSAFARSGVSQNPQHQLYSGFEIVAAAPPGAKVLIWGIDKAGRACRLA